MRKEVYIIFSFVLILISFSLFAQISIQTKAEASNFTQTSTYADVMEFLNKVSSLSETIKITNFGRSVEGRKLPLVIVSQPPIFSPDEAISSGKLVVLAIGNIHAGEVEGKEAILNVLRRFASDDKFRKLLDRLIFLAVPIFNADGNERISETNRPHQAGPHAVGIRENSQGLDLNRDFTKLETPEVSSLIQNVVNRWNPHLIIDCHTTNGSYHGYVLTYATALNPNTDEALLKFARDEMLPEITKAMLKRYNYRTYFYGNFVDPLKPEKGWITFDHRPRFGTNYIGLINKIPILSEAYAYADFRTRIDATEKFICEILNYAFKNRDKIFKILKQAQTRTTKLAGNDSLGIKFKVIPFDKPVKIHGYRMIEDVDPLTGERSLKKGDKLEIFKTQNFGAFEAIEWRKVPIAYIFRRDEKIVKKLIEHGIAVEKIIGESFLDTVEVFIIDSLKKSERKFQGHNEARLFGRWEKRVVVIDSSFYYVSMEQPRARLIFYLLEPESDDGFVNWNFFDDEVEKSFKNGGEVIYSSYKVFNRWGTPKRIINKTEVER